MSDTLQQLAAEIQSYQDHKEELLVAAQDKFVLIHGADIIGVFDSKLEAIAEGHKRIGPVPFLVKKVERVDTPVRILTPRI